MPGNKYSDRKKKNVQQSTPTTVKLTEKAGRPKKEILCFVNDKKQEQEVSIERNRVIKITRADSLRISNLTKRHSDISKFYDAFLGASLHKFPSSKLPFSVTEVSCFKNRR